MFDDLPEFSEKYYNRVELLTATAKRGHDIVIVTHTPPIVTIYINYQHIAKIIINVDINTGEVVATTDLGVKDALLNTKCNKVINQYKRFVHSAFMFSALR